MKLFLLVLPSLLASLAFPVAAEPWGFMQVGDLRRSELRDAVEAHRASQREEVRRQEAAAGRRLTAAELAELRQQVRQQWVPRQGLIQSAESRPAERMVTAPVTAPVPVPTSEVRVAPRSQRP